MNPKSILKPSNQRPVSPKEKPNRFKVTIKNLLRNQKEAVRRQTLISWHGEASKKNLAYYDKDIYALLKRRKDAKVILYWVRQSNCCIRSKIVAVQNYKMFERFFLFPSLPRLFITTRIGHQNL